MELRSDRVLALAGVTAWLGISSHVVASVVPAGTREPVVLALGIAALASFGPAFVALVFIGRNARRSRAKLVLATWLVACAMVLDSDLAYVVALPLGLVFRPRHAIVWLLVTMAASVAALVLGARPGAAWLFGHFAWMAFAFAAGFVAASEQQRRSELAIHADRLLQARVDSVRNARLEERLELARELHDTVGHHLTAISVQLELARHLVDGDAGRAVENAQRSTRELLVEVRGVVGAWRSAAQPELIAALEQLARGTSSVPVELEVESGLRIEPTLARVLYQCAREGLTNVIRHAGASRARIRLRQRDAGIELSVEDDGRGADDTGGGHGLPGLRERLQQCGGRLALASVPAVGFRLVAWVPNGRWADVEDRHRR